MAGPDDKVTLRKHMFLLFKSDSIPANQPCCNQDESKGAGDSVPTRQLRQTRSQTARNTDSAAKPAGEVSHHPDEDDVDIEHLSSQAPSELDIMNSPTVTVGTQSGSAASVDTTSSSAVSLDVMTSPPLPVDTKASPGVSVSIKTSPVASVDAKNSPAVSVDIMASPAVPLLADVLHSATSLERAKDVSLSSTTSLMCPACGTQQQHQAKKMRKIRNSTLLYLE